MKRTAAKSAVTKSSARGPTPPPATEPPRHTLFHKAFYSLLTLCVLVLLAYVGVLLLSRTPGMASAAADKVATLSGLPSKVDTMRLTAGLDLVLSNLRIQTDAHRPYAVIEYVRAHRPWADFDQQDLDVQASLVRLAPDGEVWRPRVLQPLAGALLRWTGIQSGPAPDWPGPPLSMTCERLLLDLPDAPILEFQQVNLQVSPMSYRQTRIVYWKFEAVLMGEPFLREGVVHRSQFYPF